MVLRQVFLILQKLINFIKFKREVAPSRPLIMEDEQYVPSRGWAEMIKKVYEVDPLICPACGGQIQSPEHFADKIEYFKAWEVTVMRVAKEKAE